MRSDINQLIDRSGGVATRAELLAEVSPHVLDYAVRSGRLARPFPMVYVDPAREADPWVRARAALYYAGPGAALAALTALGVWRLPGGDVHGPVHVLVPWQRRRRADGGIVVHRRIGFVCEAPEVVYRAGLPTCRVERAVIDSWPRLPGDARRAAVIAAVADRMTTAERLLKVIDTNQTLPGRSELSRLVSLLGRGCRSELELWGYEHVFVGPDLPPFERNVPIRLGDRTIYLDVYCRTAQVNFELDGAKWHTSPRDRERDVRRDAALAAMGIMVVRFTHDQLVYRPDEVRAQIRAIIATRRRYPSI